MRIAGEQDIEVANADELREALTWLCEQMIALYDLPETVQNGLPRLQERNPTTIKIMFDGDR